MEVISRKATSVCTSASEPHRERREIRVDEQVLKHYVDQYELAPNFILSVTQANGHLFAKVIGQPRCEVFAETEASFFYKIVDARIDFETDADGKVQRLVLHQSGSDVVAKRLE